VTLGLELGPEPATHDHCTLDDMIANNSCGHRRTKWARLSTTSWPSTSCPTTAPAWSFRAVDDEEYASSRQEGARVRSTASCGPCEISTAPRSARATRGSLVASCATTWTRCSAENDFDLARALVGSAGTCALVLRAGPHLIPTVRYRSLVLLGYPSHGSSGDDVGAVVGHSPIALEGLDAKTISCPLAKGQHQHATGLFPNGPKGWLMAHFGADTRDGARFVAHGRAAAAQQLTSRPTITVIDDEDDQMKIWSVREAALGATAQVPHLPPCGGAGRTPPWPRRRWASTYVAPAR